jgi:Ras-related protein Rab-18
METLNAHNHFIQPFGTEAYYNLSYESNNEPSKVPTRSRPYNTLERTPTVQEKSGAKADSIIEKKAPIERKVSCTPNDMSLAKGPVPVSCEHPRNNNGPASPIPDYFEEVCPGTSDAESGEREYFMRCVVIGAENTGKNTLIYSNFINQSQKIEKAKNGVNFIAKEKGNFKTTRKYHFWVRTLGDNSETKESIWKTYYRYSDAFVFVYDTTNKESFKALEEAVKRVLRVVPKEKFFGILVGNKNDLYTKSAVDYNEVVEFKRKYNLNHFVETCSSIESEFPQLLPRLNTKIKLIFEEI